MKFIRITEDRNLNLFPFYLFSRSWGARIKPILGENYQYMKLLFKNSSCWYFGEEKQYIKLGKMVFERIIKEDFDKEIEKNTLFFAEKVLQNADSVLEADLENKNNPELGKLIVDLTDSIEELNAWGQCISLMEYGNNDFVSGGLEEYIKSQGKKLLLKRPYAKDTGTLITPTKETFLRKKNRKILELALEISSDKKLLNKFKEERTLPKKLQEKLSEIVSDYCWVSYGYEGPALYENHFLDEINSIVNSDKSVSEQKKEFDEEFLGIKELQKKLEKVYEINSEFKRRFELARTSMFLKEYRKQVLFKAFYALEKIHRQLSKRFAVSLLQLRQFLPEELSEMIKENKFDVNESNQRIKGCVFVMEKEQSFVLSGKKAEKTFNEFLGKEEKFDDVKEFKGNTAFPGKAKGKAKIVLGTSHLYKLEKGDILVSYSTNPLMIPALKNVSGIVTDSGGVTCHAAIVSREFKIPCVIGTKIATKVLNDGDIIELDAEKGVVKILKKVEK